MYTVNTTRNKSKKLVLYVAFALAIIATLVFVVWYILRQNDMSSASFNKTGGTISVVAPKKVDFTTDEFSITLPEGWVLDGKLNPHVDEVYYYFRSTVKDYDNRYLKVFVDVYPSSFGLDKILPIVSEGSQIVPGYASEACSSFSGAPVMGTEQKSVQTWTAKYQGVEFICNMKGYQNQTGTGNSEHGYGVPVSGPNGTHKYFFVYIDLNVRPDASIFTDALKSFRAL